MTEMTKPTNNDDENNDDKNDSIQDTDLDCTIMNLQNNVEFKLNGSTDDEQDDWPIFDPLSFCYPLQTYIRDWKQVKNELLSGLVVAFAQVPESVAFAILADENSSIGKIEPIQGLQAAWIVGLITSLFGGRTTMISGSTGAIAAVLATVGDKNFIYPIIIMSGFMIVLCGIFNLTQYARLIPHSAMIGFVNGLAIIIAKSQFHAFHDDDTDSGYVEGWKLFFMILLAIITFLVIIFLPKLTKIIPSSLAGILIATFIEYIIFRLIFDIETRTISDLGTISGGLPEIIFYDDSKDLPSFFDNFMDCFVPSLWIVLVAISEDVMTIDVVSELTNSRPKTIQKQISMVKQQIIAMGMANIVGGLLGTIGGGSTIGLSMINCFQGSNGKYRISGVVVAIFVFIVVLIGGPIIGAIPVAALVGIMSVVVYHTFEWNSIIILLTTILPLNVRLFLQNKLNKKSMRKIQRADAFIIVLVTFLTIVTNLGIAIAAGLIFCCIVYSWQSSKNLKISTKYIDIDDKKQVKIYCLDGPLFFGNSMSILSQFKPKTDPKNIEIHLQDTHIYDYSAINALNTIGQQYKKLNKNVHLQHVQITSRKLITKAHHLMEHFTYDTVADVKRKGDFSLSQSPVRLHITQPINAPL